MYRTLKELKQAVDNLVEQQGGDAAVASFIFTCEDVQTTSENDEELYTVYCDDLEEAYPGITREVLYNLGDTDYIYSQIAEIIEQEVNRFIEERK